MTMWTLATPWWELTARAALVYLFLLVLLRLTGKRQVGQLAPFDLVLLLILSNAVQNAMNAGDNSLTAGLILATVLVVLNGAVGYATFRSKWLEALVEGRRFRYPRRPPRPVFFLAPIPPPDGPRGLIPAIRIPHRLARDSSSPVGG